MNLICNTSDVDYIFLVEMYSRQQSFRKDRIYRSELHDVVPVNDLFSLIVRVGEGLEFQGRNLERFH